MKTKWTPVEYKITYGLGEGTNNASNPASYTIEDEISLYDATGSSETLCFAGWHTESAFQNKITSIPSGSKKDYTLYLGWKYNIPVNIETSADTPQILRFSWLQMLTKFVFRLGLEKSQRLNQTPKCRRLI